MAYVTGTITSSNPAADLYAAIAPAFTAAGYTLDDTVVISTRTHKIWKSPAAGNAAGLDMWIDVAYPTTGAGDLSFLPMELYDAATDTAYRMVTGNTSSTTIDATTYSRWGATGQTLESTNLPLRAGNSGLIVYGTSTSTFGYWVSVTPERVVLLNSIAPSQVIYAGFYELDPLHAAHAGAAAYPLVAARIAGDGVSNPNTGPNDAALGFNRFPRMTSFPGWGTTGYIRTLYEGLYRVTPIIPTGSTAVMGTLTASPFVVVTGYQSGNLAPAGVVGYLYDIAAAWVVSTVVRGDTVTVAGNPWVMTSYNASWGVSFIFKAA